MKYIKERKYHIFQRIGVVILATIAWWAIGLQWPLSFLTSFLVNFAILFAAEFSFEFRYPEVEGKKVGNVKKLHIRSGGRYWRPNWFLRCLLWIPAKIGHIMGYENMPLLAIMLTVFYIYALLFEGMLWYNVIYRLSLLWFLYWMRKKLR